MTLVISKINTFCVSNATALFYKNMKSIELIVFAEEVNNLHTWLSV